jgi:hypothetical protein
MIPGYIRPIEDPLEAATLKAKIKQQKMRAARLEREAAKQDGYISKSIKFKDENGNEVGEDLGSEEDEFYDSDAMVYDSEEEAEEEKQFNEEQRKFIMNGKQMGEVPLPEDGYDANVEVKKV